MTLQINKRHETVRKTAYQKPQDTGKIRQTLLPY